MSRKNINIDIMADTELEDVERKVARIKKHNCDGCKDLCLTCSSWAMLEALRAYGSSLTRVG